MLRLNIKKTEITVPYDIMEVEARIPPGLWEKVTVYSEHGYTVVCSNILTPEEQKALREALRDMPVLTPDEVIRRQKELGVKIRTFKEQYVTALTKFLTENNPPKCPKCGREMVLYLNNCHVEAECTGCCLRIVMFRWC